MNTIKELNTKRKNIIKSIDSIHRMRKGTLNTMHQKVTHKNGEEVLKGPYYVLTRKGAGGKTITKSISAKDMPRVNKDVDSYKEFRRLADEYVEVCESIALLESTCEDAKKN